MVRRLLTYQLIFAVAVGPLLCCCTAGRLLASAVVPPPPRAAAPKDAPAPCCAHKREPAKSAPDGGHPDPAPSPPKPGDKCPCKDHHAGKSQAVPAVSASAETSTLLRAVTSLDLPVPSGTAADLFPARCGPEPDLARRPNASLPSTADLLFAHHNLSC
jgi:hypothetical protein